jgi:acetyl esterase/lipase
MISHRREAAVLARIAVWVVGAVLVVAGVVYAAFQLSPWPTVLLIRYSADDAAAQAAASAKARMPAGVTMRGGLSYAPGDRDALFDVYVPTDAEQPLPAIVWVHGGGFISGSRSDLTGYLTILAGRGYVAFGVDYTLAPEAGFPTPVRQVNAALSHILANAERFGIDPQRIFLAGDSAGAHIAAQAALVIGNPDYARQMQVEPGAPRAALRGLLLYCGPYDPGSLNFDGPFGDFMRTVLWSYVGTRDHRDARVAKLSLPQHVTADYPPIFISAGNADPLAPQSVKLADAARAKGVEVDALFFPDDYEPALPHEYQFILTTEAARSALDRSLAFLAAHAF